MELKTTNEVATELGVTPGYIRRIAARHAELKPAIKKGNTLLWSKEEVERFANRNRRMGRPPLNQSV